MKSQQVVLVEPLAPAKPLPGAPRNGCGICCLAGPCPLGLLLSRRRRGACAALRWQAQEGLYRCGAVSAPVVVVQQALPVWLWRAVPLLALALRRLARRWIAAGRGCDCSLEPWPPDRSDRQSVHD